MSPRPGRAAGGDMGLVIDPIRSPRSSVLTWGGRSEEPREGTMPRTTSSGRGGFHVEAATDLGAERDEVPAIQHRHPHLFLHREVLWKFVRPASLIVVEH